MKFGIFLAPFHSVGESPTLAFQRDLELLEHLDRLGIDEAWIGEHHTGAREIIGDPAMFIAAAAERTSRIMLGTGIISLPYHHPFMVADRMVQLDQMTRGRAMLGVGPSALVSDAYILGIDPVQLRERTDEALDVIIRLLQGETITMETDWFKMKDARLQLASYTQPHLPIGVTSAATPMGAMAAGRHGAALISVAGPDAEGFARTWGWVEEAAAANGKTADRGEWRVSVTMHLAESKKQAVDDLQRGYVERAYRGDRKAPDKGIGIGGDAVTIDEAIEGGNSLMGSLIVGTPDDAIEEIEAIVERSGGVGGIINVAHEWANSEATLKSYELLARYVAPHFQGQLGAVVDSRDWLEDNLETLFAAGPAAQIKAFEDAGKEVPPRLLEAIRERAEARGREAADTRE